MEKAYVPSRYEADIYKLWEESGAFKPAGDPKKSPFSIIMPPPNANGHIHVGTAMFTVEDVMIRYWRMKGHPTLWLPGMDHAGIETQIVFERELAKEGKTRFDYSPQEFYQAALEYTREHMGIMLSELKAMGFSADWSRLKFTLDDDVIDTVYDTFRKLLKDGHIYRGNRIVNWCPHCHSAFADIEIKHQQQIDPLYYIKYGPFVLATVRPETKFGDTAIAVHPKDERYQKYIGKEIEADGLLGKFKLKVIADDYVDPAFGTGVVKVTPAHDPNDWEMGLRHNLEVKQAIGTDGRLTKLAGKYAGMPVVDARQQVAQDLEAAGLIDHIEMNYSHNVAYHSRCGTQIEPLVTEQWWLKVEQLVKPAIEAVKNGDIKIVPKRFEKQYISWLENLRDWNISRQNWFGIRIPVYYNTGSDTTKAPYMPFSRENEAKEYYGEGNYEAESDTFDTWFSSSQWPYATLMSSGDFERFYPTSVMETGRDILTIWVTRMVMLGLYRTGKVPFKTIYLHGLVNDERGKKMSKSKGNVINPLEKTAEYGTDALRLALTIGITPGNDGSLSDKKIEGYRNFCNKLWNVSRFILDSLPEGDHSPTTPKPISSADHWILNRFNSEITDVSKAIESYRFSEAGERIYSLLWDDLADWYIEASKVSPNPSVLTYCLDTILRLIHPFAPFVTEVIWQQLPWQSHNLIVSDWPKANKFDVKNQVFIDIMALVSQIRGISAELELKQPSLSLADDLTAVDFKILVKLAGLSEIKEGSGGLKVEAGKLVGRLLISTEDVGRYLDNLKLKLNEAGEYAKRLKLQLSNHRYLEKAPATLVTETRDRLQQTELLISKLDEQIANIKK